MHEGRHKFRRIIIVTGTPGVGKTIVSEKLAAKLRAQHVDVAEIVKREKLTSGYDRKRRTWIADTSKLAKRLQQIIKHEKSHVVVDGHYASAVIPKAKVARVFVLRRHPQQLEEQMERRGFKGAKLWENLSAEVLDVCLYDAIVNVGIEKVCEIDTTNRTVDDTVDEILSILDGKKTCTVGTVDWLGILEKENSLDQYLEHF